MSARNRLENKRARREEREVRKAVFAEREQAIQDYINKLVAAKEEDEDAENSSED